MRHDFIRITVVLACLSPAGLAAGPLDRGPMQQRVNPAAENMLRVPGVVGLYEDQALAALQQAGLAVTVKRITKDDPRYKDKEGMVVGQVPAAGGVAMIGSTVVVTIYKTGQGYQQGGYGYGGGYGQQGDYYDDGNGRQEDYYDDGYGQQGDSLSPDGGGWQPPPPGEGPGEGMDEPGFDGGNLGNDVPNVPPPSGGQLRPALPQPSVKPGTIVAKPVKPTATKVEPREPAKPLLSPAEQRELKQKIDKARSGQRLKVGTSGKPGTIVAKPVEPTATKVEPREPAKPLLSPAEQRELKQKIDRARSGQRLKVGTSGKPGTIVAKPVRPARTPVRQSVSRPDSLSPGHTRDIGRQLGKARGSGASKDAAQSEGIQPQPVRRSPVKVGQSNTQTSSPAATSKTGQMKPVGSRGIIMDTAKPKSAADSHGIIMDTAKPKAVTGVEKKKKDEEKSWFQRLFQ